MNDNGPDDRSLALGLAAFAVLNELAVSLVELGLIAEEEHASIRKRAKANLLQLGPNGGVSPQLLADAIAAVDIFMRLRPHPDAGG